MIKESPAQIRTMIDTVLRNLRALKTLNEPTDHWDTLLIYLIVSKFELSTEKEWESYKGTIISNSQGDSDSEYKLKLSELITFLRNRADMLEMINLNHGKTFKFNNTQDRNISETKKPVQSTSQTHSHSYVVTRKEQTNKSFDKKRVCSMCNGNHLLYTCPVFLNLTVKERSKIVDEKQICRNCLRSGHSLNDCLFGPCKQCQLKHNTLLHFDRSNNTGAGQPSAVYNESADDRAGPSHTTTALHSWSGSNTGVTNSHSVLLSTALVEVADKDNNFHTFRALLDNGSQHCFVTERLSKRVRVPLIQSTVHVSGVGQAVTQSNSVCKINMRSRTSDYDTSMSCIVLPCITPRLPSHHIDIDMSCIPENISLADPNFYTPSDIDLLIGADKFWELLHENKIRLPNGPYLQNTKLGWLISGPIQSNSLIQGNIQCNFVQGLDAEMRKFWEVEDIPRVDKLLTDDEKYCEKIFMDTTTREDDGRFAVRIPLKESPELLGDSYNMAEKRFMSLERKLNRLPSYKQLYVEFMREYEQMNHMTEVNTYGSSNYFLPHHGVFRESSSTTKLRVVFDASAAASSGKSLNDIQQIGPKLQNDIPRLELCGALIGAKLYKKIIDSLRLSFDHVFFWTDSTIVMGWLRMSPHLLKTFVQNRVTEINELTGDMQWLHVSSGDNPADLVSRGLNLDMLSRSSLWWSGPSFLYDRETNWRNNNIPSENNLPEVRGNPIIATTTSIQFPNVIDFEKYSSYIKLKRVFAYVLRFINNSRKRQSINQSFSQSSVTGNRSNRVIDLSAQELLSSEQKLARLAQLQSFPDIFCCLRNKLPLKSVKNKKLYNKIVGLNIFLDDNEVIRIGGRLCNSSSFSYNKKHPILLCSKHRFAPLTPGHFLIGRSLTAPVHDDLTSRQANRLPRYDRIEQMRQHFWRRWSTEYISELQLRTKWKTKADDLQLNTLVLIKEDNWPPLKWRMGRITRLYPGKDGVSRVADIRTASGVIQRAFSKICPLPLEPSPSSSVNVLEDGPSKAGGMS
ncbi:uncharacterized protein LOC126371560 [Pectinophora gossypiella]|uniref:uncharacterized protein LOC126371560 n=1 Tax=Pectinophora gossypiella TaxID=13191 RepID=UPI00214F0AA3|nr:uncharacterized protein LOC126371560 [Pectinophora gossypiella]